MAKQRFINFGERVKTLRQELGLSQDTVGTQGFVSTPGWIKIENGQRQASEKLIERFTKWLVESKHLRAGAASTLKTELLTLKYMGSNSRFVQEMAQAHAARLPGGALLAPEVVKSPKTSKTPKVPEAKGGSRASARK